jgi:hypothetical protein
MTEHQVRIAELLRGMQYGLRGLTIESSHPVANSALSRAATAAACLAGYHVLALPGSQSEQSAPLTALAELLDERDAPSPVADLSETADRLRDRLLERTATAPVLLVVDDASALDVASARVLEDTIRKLPVTGLVGVLIATTPRDPVLVSENLNSCPWSRHTFGRLPLVRRA